MKRILLHFLSICVISLILIVAVYQLLSLYTDKNKIVKVPLVEGVSEQEAARVLSSSGLYYEIIDSVFRQGGSPGAIIDQIPKAGSDIKAGRTLFLTMQAKSVQQVMVPNLTDYSLRQAESLLRSLGFTHVNVIEKNSLYKDLVLSVEYNGVTVESGKRVPITASVNIYVGNGLPEYHADTIMTDEEMLLENPDESFF